jgi:basic membrane lipoprotein Med (substrate-binding protein (PBP1-ABC) superfamily)
VSNNNNNNTKKLRIHHLEEGYKEDGKWTQQHSQAIESADRIFNAPSTTRLPTRVKKPEKKK